MKKIFLISIVFLGLLTSCQKEHKKVETTSKNNPNEVVFFANDSLKLYGDLHVLDKKKPIILLFHQAGANAKGEYSTIIPVLLKEGFNVFAVDQRTGGQTFGNYNRTVAEIPANRFGYCDAYPDLEAALKYVYDTGFTGKKIVWGSSYSAALVIKLGFENSDKIDGVLAFSPASGAPMKGCDPNEYFEKIKTPMFVLRPKREMEYESVKTQFELAKKYNHQVYIAENGVHGSSMLVESRTKSTNDQTWKAVTDFLSALK